MKIVIATPLYPPDIAPAAAYAKELAKRLSIEHEVTVVAYSSFPEQLPKVKVLSISKRYRTAIRTVLFFFKLLRAALSADTLLCLNGSSVELPASLVALTARIRLTLIISDPEAHEYVQSHSARRAIESFAFRIAAATQTDLPKMRPEKLPGVAWEKEFQDYEASWNEHLVRLAVLFA